MIEILKSINRIAFGLAVLVFLLAGCSPNLTINKDGSVVATNYAIVQGTNSYVPKPVISTGFADSIVKLAESLGSKVISTGASVVVPAPKPAPTPSPILSPTPTPIPPSPPIPAPVPAPISSSTVLFDLTTVWQDMQQAGFPCREGVCLYALGQVARGYPIPGQSEELVTIDGYYSQIKTWYEQRVNEGRVKMTANSLLTMSICVNDAKDRFGFRLCPPTSDLFQDFGGRVTLGEIFPESQY